MATSVRAQPAAPALSFLSHRLHSLSEMVTAWQERRRQRAGVALLMRLEPYMLKDIGVILAEQRGGARAMLKWHPAILAATLETRPPNPREERRDI